MTTDEMPAQVVAFPLEPGETILWWRKTDYGYELRVRRDSGFEGMHDVYEDQISKGDTK